MDLIKNTSLTKGGLEKIIRAAGLRMDLTVHGFENQWGPLAVSGHNESFTTRMPYNPLAAERDSFLSVESEVACHDSMGTYVWGTWQPCGEGIERRDFKAPGATFALTERRGVPERIFLYVYNSRFDQEVVAAKLAAHRRRHPPQIFLLPTTPKVVGKPKK